MQRRILVSACLRLCVAFLLIWADAAFGEEHPAVEGRNKESAITAFKTLQSQVKAAKQGRVEFKFTSYVGVTANIRYEWDRPEWIYVEATSIGGGDQSAWFTLDQKEILFAEQSCADEKKKTVHQRAIRVTNFRKLLGGQPDMSWQKGRQIMADFDFNMALALGYFDLLMIANPEKLRTREIQEGFILEQNAEDFDSSFVRGFLLGGKCVPVVEFEMSKDGEKLRAIRMRPDPQGTPVLVIEAKITQLSLEDKHERGSVPLKIEPVAVEVSAIEKVTYDLISTQRFRTGLTP